MRFAALFAAAFVAISSTTATPLSLTVDVGSLFGTDLSASNYYGAPLAPWLSGAKAGWYFGDHGHLFPDLPCLQGLLCKILQFLPFDWLHCPVKPPPTPPSDGYTQTFANLTGATQADGYMTYGLVDTVAQCKAMCNSVVGCKFVNTYHDVNGKGGSTQLTCSLFNTCYNATTATNTGGQTQPNGSVDFITNSDGYCKQ